MVAEKYLCIISFSLFLLASCDTDKQNVVKGNLLSEGNTAHRETPISVVDDLGREVTLGSPAKRIVALAPHIVENLFSAELGGRVVAAVDYSDYPSEALDIPRVGGYADFSIETILSFKPDLVVGWASGYKGFTQLQDKLEALNIALFVDEPTDLRSITYSVERFARLGGTWDTNATGNSASSSVVRQRVEKFLDREKVLRDKYKEVLHRPKVFYQIWHDPLQTLGGEHIVSSLIELCGGQSIFSDSLLIAPQVNVESIIDRDPGLIVFTAEDEQVNAVNLFWEQWPTISAVDQQYIFRVNSDWLSRHTLRMMNGVDQLCDFIKIARRT